MPKKGFSYATVQMIAILYLVVWSISPPMEIDLIYRLLALASAAVWVVILAIRQSPIVMEKDQVIALFFLVAVIAITYIQEGDLNAILRQIPHIMLVLCFLINYFYRDSWHELYWIIPVVLILCIVWNFNTVRALAEDPTIARAIVRDDESIYGYLRQGIGGYSLIYPQVCVFPAVLAWIIKAFKNNKVYFIIGCVWLFTYVRFILSAGYSLAIFATLAGAFLLLVYKGESGLKAFLIAMIIFGGAMLAILYLEDFRNWLLQIFDGTAVAKKINDLVSSSDSGAAEGSIASRIDAYKGSVTVALKYPLIGALWRESGGGHSALFDVLAKYGIWGAFIYSKMLYSVPNYYKKKSDNSFIKKIGNATLVSLLLVSILDSFTYSFMCMILLVLPLFFEQIIKWSEVEE